MAFLLMSDSQVDCHCHSDSFLGCGCVWKGGCVGTVYCAYNNQKTAEEALEIIQLQKLLQRADLEAWGKRSWAENPIIPIPEDGRDPLIRGMRAHGDRNQRRAEWMEKNPMPRMDLQHNFWVVEIRGMGSRL